MQEQNQRTSPWLIAWRVIFTFALIGCIVFIFSNSLQIADEVHNNPAKAKCDGAQSLTPDQFDELMGFITKEVEFFGKKMN